MASSYGTYQQSSSLKSSGLLFQSDSSSKSSLLNTTAENEDEPPDDQSNYPLEKVPREYLIKVLQARSRRIKQCRSIPASILLYFVFIGAMLLHCRVEPAWQFESSLAEQLVTNTYFDPFTISSPTALYAWMRNSFLPVVLYDPNGVPDSDDDYARIVKAPQMPGRILNNYGLIIGGIRIVQTRASPISCPDTMFNRLYNDTCYARGGKPSSSINFGDIELAKSFNIESAFQPSTSGGGLLPDLVSAYDNGPFFQYYIDGFATLLDGQTVISNLEDSQFLDEGTTALAIQMSLYNGQTNYFGTVELAASFTQGGRVEPTFRFGSFSTNPYLGYEWTYILDISIILYGLYLLRSTLWRIYKGWRDTKGDIFSKASHAFQLWHVLDILATSFIWSAIILWADFNVRRSDARTKIINDPNASPISYASSTHADTMTTIFGAFEVFAAFKISASWALIVLSLRLFKYFQFQPRLAVITDSLIMAFKDGIHFAVLFTVILVCYGVWGHFMFGSQAIDWHDINTSIVSIFRFMMYDYDLVTMESTGFVAMADFFFCSYMLLITNLVLWMFLAIIFESYTTIRMMQADQPSLVDELVILVRSSPPIAETFCPCLVRKGVRTHPATTDEMLADLNKGRFVNMQIGYLGLVKILNASPEDATVLLAESLKLVPTDGDTSAPLSTAMNEAHGADTDELSDADRFNAIEKGAQESREIRVMAKELSRALQSTSGDPRAALMLRALSVDGHSSSRPQTRPQTKSSLGKVRSVVVVGEDRL
jgi:hypothetical protein